MSRHSRIAYQVVVDYENEVDIDEGRGAFLLALQSFIQSQGGLGGFDGETLTERVTVNCTTENAIFIMDLRDWSFEFIELDPRG